MKATIRAAIKDPAPACACGSCKLCRNRARRLGVRQREAKQRAASGKTDEELDREAEVWIRGVLREMLNAKGATS